MNQLTVRVMSTRFGSDWIHVYERLGLRDTPAYGWTIKRSGDPPTSIHGVFDSPREAMEFGKAATQTNHLKEHKSMKLRDKYKLEMIERVAKLYEAGVPHADGDGAMNLILGLLSSAPNDALASLAAQEADLAENEAVNKAEIEAEVRIEGPL